MTSDPTTVAKLDELLTAIRAYPDPRRAADEWKQAFRLLQKAGLPTGRVTGVVGMRDVAGLTTMIQELSAPAEAAPPAGEVPSEETCRLAMRAYRKRQALTQLDEESQLGRSPLSKGAATRPTAIIPPAEWPESVWQELARQGKLKYIGHGFYELPREANE